MAEEYFQGSYPDILFSEDVQNFIEEESRLHFDTPLSEQLHSPFSILPDTLVTDPDSTQVISVPLNLPTATCRLPSMEDYTGPCSFEVDFSKSTADKAKWWFSSLLNKLFVNMDCKIPLTFKWRQTELGLFIRALPVFLSHDSFEEPVMRCASHRSSRETSNKDFEFVDHIIRSDHANAFYQCDADSKRYSVLVPLDIPQAGTDGTTVMYTFMCKNSCVVGINRRATGVIFTLERASGEVIGRKMLKIRICSCPHRDLNKEESNVLGKLKKERPEGLEENERNTTSNHIPGKTKIAGGKKPLKRLSKGVVNLTVPKEYAKSMATVLRESILMMGRERPLNPEERMCIGECNILINEQLKGHADVL